MYHAEYTPPGTRHKQARQRLGLAAFRIGFGSTFVAALMVSSCNGAGGSLALSAALAASPHQSTASSTVTTQPVATTPAGASQRVTVQVAANMASSPFNVPRTLLVPPGFAIRLFARVPHARFMALAPNGDLLVSDPSAGSITLLRPNGNAAPTKFTFATGLRQPHDIAFQTTGTTVHLYIAESNRIIRAVYQRGATRIATTEVIVDDLPDSATPGLGHGYSHPLKNFALHGNKLYLSIGSSCNACSNDTTADPVRGAIYEYDLDGKNRRLFARGIRNAEGLAFRPGTNELWAVMNNRDNIRYPFHRDFDGDGSDDYGRVLQSYVDGHPPEPIIRVKDGGQYGWPFCNSNPDQGLDNMPYDRDVEFNVDGAKLDCSKIDRPAKGIAAHSAPLGMSFLQNSGLPVRYRNALAVALHGCWNCSAFNGHKIALYPFAADGTLGAEVDLVSGWVTDAVHKQRWGRPVDVISDGQQGLYISDDMAGAIYQLSTEK